MIKDIFENIKKYIADNKLDEAEEEIYDLIIGLPDTRTDTYHE